MEKIKKRKNSKKKGNAGERAIAKLLNDYYDTEEFKRVPTSGAFGTIHRGTLTESESNVFQGDILTPDWFKWVIEVKSYKDVNLYKIFTSGKTLWDNQLKEEQDNLKNKKGVILVFKQNNRDWLAKINKGLFDKIKVYPRIEFKESIILKFSDLLKILNKDTEKK